MDVIIALFVILIIIYIIFRPSTKTTHEIERRKEKGVYYTNIVGISKKNDDGISRQDILMRCELGEALNLVREPKNPYDKNAIGVLRKNGEQLGYIKKEIASWLAPQIDDGNTPITKVAAALYKGDGPYAGCLIEMDCHWHR